MRRAEGGKTGSLWKLGLMGEDSSAKRLLEAFKEKARSATDQVELIKVLRSNSFRIGNSHVLVRVAADTGKYFFGLNYINAEEVANLDNAYIAFVCGDVNNTLLVPMAVMMKHLPQISHDRNGEYKINITRELELTLKGRGNRLPLEPFLNQWESLLGGAAKLPPGTNAAEESFHAVIQGRLLDIGNRRGFETYSPNRAKTFNSRPLGEIARLRECPTLQFTNHDSLRNIDVIWFRHSGDEYYPERAFEVELSTGVWSGVGRLATLREYPTPLIVISNEPKRFQQVMESHRDLRERFRNVSTEDVGRLYRVEIQVAELRAQIGF